MIRRYRKGDAAKVDVQPQQADEAVQRACFEKVTSFALVDGEDVLAVFGFWVSEERQIECFALLGRKSGRKLLELVRFARKAVPAAIKTYRLKGAEMTVKCGFEPARRMASLMGFVPVGVLPAFFNGKDYQLFERRN